MIKILSTVSAVRSLLALACWLPLQAHSAGFLSAAQLQAEISALCTFVSGEYAYLEQKKTDWTATCSHLQSQVPNINTRADYLRLLESGLRELYDEHIHLGSANPDAQRLAPSHTDLRARWQQGRAIIFAVRGSAANAGIKPGMEVLAIDGQAVHAASAPFTPRFLRSADSAAADYGLQQALAGPRNQAQITLLVKEEGGKQQEIRFQPRYPQPEQLLSSSMQYGIAHIRIHNALGDEKLIPAFDQALRQASTAKALILDLRDTPSGGNSLVARAILGHFVQTTQAYQRHELVQEERENGVPRIWVEYVAPRAPYFSGPVLVLSGPWTGSMGEGLSIGLHAAAGAAVYGQEMAQLLGALGEIRLPHSQLVARIPVEKLYHVQGLPREAFRPCPLPMSTGQDPQLQAAYTLAQAAIDKGTTRHTTRHSNCPFLK